MRPKKVARGEIFSLRTENGLSIKLKYIGTNISSTNNKYFSVETRYDRINLFVLKNLLRKNVHTSKGFIKGVIMQYEMQKLKISHILFA